MTTKKRISKRITSFFLVFAMLVTMLPLAAPLALAADANGNRLADPSTMDSWKDFFPITGEISTENAGGVWMDKSVFTNATAFGGLLSQDDPNSFLVALSAMAANRNITGKANVPTDTMLVLDVSGSMNEDNNNVANALVTAANESIATLLTANKYNRVGVVLYSGPSTQGGATSAGDAVLVLPLGRYSTGKDGKYLSYTKRNSTETVALDKDVVYEGTSNKPAAKSKTVVGGTYIQKGIITAMNEFTAADNKITVDDPVMGTLHRKPVLVLMSDGAPTVGSTSFTAPGTINLGDGTYTNAALGFVSQLTASYAKDQIEEKYQSDALLYTLGLGLGDDSVAVGVLDPANPKASTALGDFWTQYNQLDTDDTLTVQAAYGRTPARKVTKINAALDENYVDQYFAADGTGASLSEELEQAFKDIVGAIQLQSGYFPTLVAESEELSGYVSFVDRVGQYMKVTDVKGVLIDGKLFSGADLASNFVPGGGSLGTFTRPTELGMEMVAAVRARLGLDSDDTARTLIALAYEHGQLSYTDANNYSNYIGWYANAQGRFLGFYHEGTTTLPAATGNAATDPAFLIKSYGYLGAVDESHGVSESDMMYATVQVREKIATGEQLVTFAIPAALIPIISYNVTLNETGALSDLTATGATEPIRLVYEVALDSRINSFNVNEILSAGYLADEHNVNSDGSINFYTNQWDHENTTGYGTVNTYSYFNPSRQNEKYYYLEDAPVYADTNGTLYTESAQPSGTVYRSYQVYKNNGSLRTETVYRPLSDAAKATAVRNGDGSWYIPKGNVHVNLDGYTVHKGENLTGTLSEASIPFVDTHNHNVGDTGYQFYVGATLGNNGKYTVIPETGIKLTKTMAEGAAAPNGPFTFIITNESDAITAELPAWRIDADGRETNTTVKFTDGTASVELNPGDVLYIGGMTAGHTFRIVERETAEYVATATGLSDAGTVSINRNQIIPVAFVNDDRGTGNLTIAKEVEHDFGTEYQIPADKIFTMEVTLAGIGTANATFEAVHTNGTYTEITTDANGKFNVQLKHDERFEVFGLPAGTTATVVERNITAGFTSAYWDNGVIGDGTVTVVHNSTVSVVVINDYEAENVYPVNIALNGQKTVKDAAGNIVTAWPDDYRFTIVLERHGATGWERVDSKVLDKNNKTFSFDMSGEVYDAPGVYSYQVYEVEPEIGDADRVDGMIYDIVWHTFSVYVSDEDMDGRLEIVRVHSEHAEKDFEPVNGVYTVNVDFENTQTVTVPALATVEIQKVLKNASGSPLASLAGYHFGLYTDADCTVPAVVGNGIQTISLNPTDAVGEGWIDIQLDQVGSYTFYVREIAGSMDGMSYSTSVIKVVVDVVADGGNALAAEVSYYHADGTVYDLGTDGEVEFTNTYTVTDTELIIDFVSKELTGRALNDLEFTFEVQDLDGTTILKGTNNAAGKVTFDGSLKFDKVGTYYYNIVETSTDGKGVITDKTAYRVNVTVIDVGGQLAADYVLINAAGDTITFKNTYPAQPVEHAVKGSKTLRGRTLINDEFTFVLTELTVDGIAAASPESWTAKNFADGSFAFPSITYTKAGTYTYSVEELIPEGGKVFGITYDTTQYKVTVVIEDDGEGSLYVKSEAVSLLNNTPANALTFLNEYEADPTSAQFSGDKYLTGKVDNALKGGEFQFILYNSDADWVRGTERETVENGAGGLISFGKIDIATAEDQYFLVVEKNGGQTIDGITYDDTVYRVWIQVTDDLKGQLHPKVHIYDGAGIPRDKISFVNVYEITGGATVTLSGEKVLEGRDFKDGDSFTFELYDADENYNITAEHAAAQMDAATHRYQFTLNYTAADAGKTFHYVLKERNGGQTIDGVTYSEVRYNVTVTVSDNGDGTVNAEATVAGAQTDALNFTNRYKAGQTAVGFDGTKTLNTLSGIRELKENDFTFDLYRATEGFEIDGAAIQSKQNDAEGNFSFEDVELTEAGTYYFLIKENSRNPMGGVVYDNTRYHITVVVTDNGKGSLEAATFILKVTDEASEPAETIAFVNEYNAATANVVLSGSKELTGRELREGEFKFLLFKTDGEFVIAEDAQAMVAFNSIDKTFAFDTLSFTEVGTYRFVIMEDTTVEAERVSFDDAVYYVTIEVTDDENGKFVASDPVIVKKGSAETVEAVTFTNVFVPKPQDITVEIDIHKTIVNKGTDSITPEGFEFLLKPVADGVDGITEKSDAEGNAKFTLTFTEDDIGKVFHYTLTEVNSGAEGVTYSTAEYAITVEIALNKETNTLAATLTQNEAETAELVADFENIYEMDIPSNPQTGDTAHMALWLALLLISCGAVITLYTCDKRKNGEDAFAE